MPVLDGRCAFALALLVIAGSAEAQSSCEGGRTPTAEGFCCWPGQHWDPHARACAGTPSCGPGHEASGEECVPLATTATVTCDGGRTPTAEGLCCWPGQHFARAEGGCAGTPFCPSGTSARGAECVTDGPSPEASARVHSRPAPTDAPAVESDDEDDGGILFRSILHTGYAHFLYLTSERDGGGPVLAASFTLGYRAPGGLYVGGSAGFEPILAASGETGVASGRASWGPTFTPRGFVGITLGYASGVVELDATLTFGGGGNSHMGGFGIGVIPTLSLSFVNAGSVHFGVALRPSLAILYDFGSNRGVVDLGVTGGLSFSVR